MLFPKDEFASPPLDSEEGLRTGTYDVRSGLLRADDPERTLSENPFRGHIISAGREGITFQQYRELNSRWGYGYLDEAGINLVRECTAFLQGRVVSIGAGLGYVEEQLAQAGLDVVAFDKVLHENPLFPSVQGIEEFSVESNADRALFIGFPDRPSQRDPTLYDYAVSAVRDYWSVGGELLMLLGPERASHIFGPSKELEMIEHALRNHRTRYEVTPPILMPGLAEITHQYRMQTERSISLDLRIYNLRDARGAGVRL